MNFTYREEVAASKNEMKNIPHCILNQELQSFLENRGLAQNMYKFDQYPGYFFIYLVNGDRIDVLY